MGLLCSSSGQVRGDVVGAPASGQGTIWWIAHIPWDRSQPLPGTGCDGVELLARRVGVQDRSVPGDDPAHLGRVASLEGVVGQHRRIAGAGQAAHPPHQGDPRADARRTYQDGLLRRSGPVAGHGVDSQRHVDRLVRGAGDRRTTCSEVNVSRRLAKSDLMSESCQLELSISGFSVILCL